MLSLEQSKLRAILCANQNTHLQRQQFLSKHAVRERLLSWPRSAVRSRSIFPCAQQGFGGLQIVEVVDLSPAQIAHSDGVRLETLRSN